MAENMTYEPVTGVTALAARVAELERENAAATKLLDSCLKFLSDLDTDDWPAGLDYAIRHFKRQAAGEISWDESSDQTLRRELTAALFSDMQPDDDTDAPLVLAAIDEDGDE
jgi:hypothetical protein